MTMRKVPNKATIMVNFLVMKTPSTYNTIIGKLIVNALKVATWTYHLMVKFMTP